MPALLMRVGLVVNPWMYGLAYISRMPRLSAPSAKILTFRSARAGTSFFIVTFSALPFQERYFLEPRFRIQILESRRQPGREILRVRRRYGAQAPYNRRQSSCSCHPP